MYDPGLRVVSPLPQWYGPLCQSSETFQEQRFPAHTLLWLQREKQQMDLDANAYIWLHVHAYACICMHMHAYACTSMHMHAYGMHAYACIYIYIHIYT